MVNLYKAEYERQHPPKRGMLWLKTLSIIIAVLIVLLVGSLDAKAATATQTEYSDISISDEEYELLKRKGKTTGTHGGVANLLKTLTKTMEKQGADIRSIAKV